MKLFTAETFGPVVAMTKFDGSEEEAIRLANNSGKSECSIMLIVFFSHLFFSSCI
jgi:acyl-CoA reductase-like NAD-dependent aldehyde dehydrogenase